MSDENIITDDSGDYGWLAMKQSARPVPNHESCTILFNNVNKVNDVFNHTQTNGAELF